MEKDRIILTNWSPQDPVIRQSNLGWNKGDCLDAETNNPEGVFNYFWKHAFSIVFYYTIDGDFYELYMESTPFKFWRVPKRKDWDGKWICDSIDWNEHEEGEVLSTFTDDTDLWNTLTLNGKTIGEVLSQSIITEINY